MPSQIDNYTCTKTLGQGISAKVKLAQDQDGKYFALKVYPKDNQANSEMALKTLADEANAYMQLDHPNILKIYEFKQDAVWRKSGDRECKVAYLVMEFVNRGDLFDYVSLNPFKPEICRYYFK